MRSGAHHPINIPFEIERSNSICEQRRYSCRARLFYFFQNPSHFFAIDVQSWAIFKTGKNGMFFWRLFILREAQAKNKKKRNCQRCARTSSIKKTQLEVFYKKKMAPKVVRRERFFRFQKRCEVGLQSLEAFFFSKDCQNSPNCRKNISRPVMNSPGIGLPSPGI